MKLKQVDLTHFRCFEHVKVPLPSDVNVFVGANAAGKTTILDGLAIALNDVVDIIAGPTKKRSTTKRSKLQPTDVLVTSTSDDPALATKDFVQFRAEANDYYQVTGFERVTESGKSVALEWTDHLSFRMPGGFTKDGGKSAGIPEVRGYFTALWNEVRVSSKQSLIPIPVLAYYRADRTLSSMPPLGNVLAQEQSRGDAFLNAMDAGANFTAMCQWFYLRENDEVRRKVKPGADPGFEHHDLKAARDAIRQMLPGVGRVYFDGSPPRMYVTFEQADGTSKPMELRQLSDGYRAMLALTLDFARRLALAHPHWEEPLKAPGILLIDEIELHLHPRWQQEVIPSLRRAFPNTQLVVTTHSPQVLSTVERSEIHVLTSDHTLERLPSNIGTHGAENSRILFEVFGVSPRPQSVESVGALNKYLDLIESGAGETVEAKALRERLDADLGSTDPALMAADVRISQRKALGRKKQ